MIGRSTRGGGGINGEYRQALLEHLVVRVGNGGWWAATRMVLRPSSLVRKRVSLFETPSVKMGLHFCAANGNCPPLLPLWRRPIYIYIKREREREKIDQLYGDVAIFPFLSSILSLLLLYPFYFVLTLFHFSYRVTLTLISSSYFIHSFSSPYILLTWIFFIPS